MDVAVALDLFFIVKGTWQVSKVPDAVGPSGWLPGAPSANLLGGHSSAAARGVFRAVAREGLTAVGGWESRQGWGLIRT